MATFQKQCDIYQGYNYKKDKQTPIGFITSIKVGDTTLTVDQTCKDPMSPADDLKVVAVLSGVLWELGVTDALYFSGQISITNKQAVQLLTYTDLTKVDVSCKFTIYDYDPVQKAYFKCLLGTDDAELTGLLEKNGEDLNLSVADDARGKSSRPRTTRFRSASSPSPRPRRSRSRPRSPRRSSRPGV